MAKEGSVAPKERVNIVYKPATDGAEEVELPLKILAIGDYTGRQDDRPVEDRKPVNIDKDNFNDVMAEQDLNVTLSIPDKLSGDDGAELGVSLAFKSMKDFSPEGVLDQVPELKKLMELREALTALKSPLGNKPAFRKRIQSLLGDDDARTRLMSELGLGGGGGGGAAAPPPPAEPSGGDSGGGGDTGGGGDGGGGGDAPPSGGDAPPAE